jgi:hypothetical protein
MKEIMPLLVLASFVVVCLLLPAWLVLRSGNWLRGMLLTWGCLVGWFIVASLAGDIYNEPPDQSPFPEGPSIVGAVFTGWIPASVISGLVVLLKMAMIRLRMGKEAEDAGNPPSNTPSNTGP